MRKDKGIVFQLRKQGKSYREIQKKVDISRSTLSKWFKDEEWSKHLKYSNNTNNIILTKDRLLKLNKARSTKLDALYDRAEKEATEEFEAFKNEPLFMAGLMAYAGEGDKVTRFSIRISNCEFYIHKYFINFSEKYLDFKRENMKCALILYPDNVHEDCLVKWSTELKIPRQNFYKVQIIQGKEKTKRLQFGVGMVIISSTFLKKKLMKWLELCKNSVQ
mgnify:FL=1